MTEEKEKNENISETEVKKDKKIVPDLSGDDEIKKTPLASATVGSPTKPTKSTRVFKKNSSFRRKRPERPRSEFDQKIIKIRRVTRVVKGGRRFSFSVAMVIGNKKGSVGVAVAKGADVALAVEKAVKKAKRDLVKLKLTANKSIKHDVESKYCSSVIKISPTKEGRGLSAGSSAKNVLELAGITDVVSKITSRSRNKLNIAMATVQALKEFRVGN